VPTHECDVAIIGGGLAGGSAALAFGQQGCSVRLFERRDLARDPNRGDIMHAPTVAIVRRLGIYDLLEERGATRLVEVKTVDPDGELSFTTRNPETLILNHAELEAAFIDAAASQGAAIQYDVARSLVRDGSARDGGWRVETDDGGTHARFLVGADGAQSLTRRTLGIPLVDDFEYDNCIVVLHGARPPWLDDEHGWQLLHPQGAVFILPTTPIGRVRLVILVRRSEARDWMASSEAELAERLGERHPLLSGLELTKRGGSHVYVLKRTHAARYSGPRAALVGDAAHTIHSMGGQGLNIAIQDSVKLAELVGPVLRDASASDEALARALDAYEAARRPINTQVIEMADRASVLARPGADAFAQALDFYRKVAADSKYLETHGPRFGGRE
jgi:2-polyprenyl-6-methoxyphenol hydroxylase-like FAD-dependent oxidoreductase